MSTREAEVDDMATPLSIINSLELCIEICHVSHRGINSLRRLALPILFGGGEDSAMALPQVSGMSRFHCNFMKVLKASQFMSPRHL